MPNQTVKNGLTIKLPQMKFLLKKQLIKFLCTYQPLSFCKILKKILSRSRVKRMHYVWAQDGLFTPNNFFWKNIINIMFILLLTTFIVQNFLKIYHNGSRVMTISPFGSKMAHLPKWECFSENLLISIVPFIRAYLYAKNKSQILIY